MRTPTGFIILLIVTAFAGSLSAACQDYAIGADVSFLAEAEQQGIGFKDSGVAKPGLEILKEHGYNWIRLRLFHSPTDLPNDLNYTITMQIHGRTLVTNPCRKPGKEKHTTNWSMPYSSTQEIQSPPFAMLTSYRTWSR